MAKPKQGEPGDTSAHNETAGERRMTVEQLNRIVENNNFSVDELLSVKAIYNLTVGPKDEPELPHDAEKPKGIEIVTDLMALVFTNAATMPVARRQLGEWVMQQDVVKLRTEGIPAMRRFKQIADGLFEEFTAVLGSRNLEGS